MRINHNIPGQFAYNALNGNNRLMQNSVRKLSTGLRINGAADDAAGLAISEKMRAQVGGLDQAVSNSQDGVNLIQTAEGALNETHSILQRMRELSVQASSDTLTANDRQVVQKEIDQMKEEIDRISSTTQFNRRHLLDGTASALSSVSDDGVKVFVRGGISGDGDFKIDVDTEAGQGQILTTSQMTLRDFGSVTVTSPYAAGSSSADGISESSTAVKAVAGGDNSLRDIANFWDENGNFILDEVQSLTISQGDGRSASITLNASDTVDGLSEKISAAISDGLGQGQFVPDPRIPFVGKGGSRSLDSSYSGVVGKIVDGLKSGWLEAAAKRIDQYYGLNASDTSFIEKITVNIYDGEPANTLASVSSSWNTAGNRAFILNIDAKDFDPATMPNGENYLTQNGSDMYGDRVIAHEMVHALVATTIQAEHSYGSSDFPTWLNEGLAEAIHGADGRVKSLLGSGSSAAGIMGSIAGGWSGSDENYAAAYTSVRYLHEKIQDAGNAGGIKELTTGLADGTYASVDAAIAGLTGYANASDFLADASGAGGQAFLGTLKLSNSDTGAIGGFDADGGSVLTATSVIDESGLTASDQPLADYGWTLTWPDDSSLSTGPQSPTLSSSVGLVSSSSSMTASMKPRTVQSVDGTIVIHSAVAGKAGELHFSGDERVLKALGLSEVQAASENRYSVTVSNANSGEMLKKGVSISGESLVGVIDPEVDLRLKANTGVNVSWNDEEKKYDFDGGTANADSFYVHLAAKPTTFQIGANQGETMSVDMGDMSAASLGVDGILVTERESAGRSITVIDGAIARVSDQRSMLGASQNRLEHAISNLTTASLNLTQSESRIRDLDMASEMLRYTGMNILMQAGNAMMGQAKQLPQNVLSLLR